MLIDKLQKLTGLPRSHLDRIARTASKRYKIYTIEKRTGGRRVIAHPSKELKAIQRWLNKALFNKLPVHNAATAYKKGAGIKMNAERHRETLFTLRMDFKDFFPSFTAEHIHTFLKQLDVIDGIQLSGDDLDFICAIVSKDEQLTIGAPSSPKITNAMMYTLDVCLSKIADEQGLVYTRYADDLFLSASEPHALDDVPKIIQELVDSFEVVRLTINHEKTAFLSRKYNRSVTGLVITPDQKVSIGRKKKKEIKSLVNSYQYGQLEPDKHAYLQGLIAFALDVEPSFVETLERKYDKEVIDRILRRNLDASE
ncbi:retron St85 family RNA-directed DNA polymerase [Terasakiella pusilla]|uniref:retron St85 family RNA-directed DNA polymerase n=1 Tax=Terasakiella pusilla TaxID=64973 RepID=UPI003AA9ACA8